MISRPRTRWRLIGSKAVRACLVPENAEFLKGLERHLVL
jgi:hypothetical protein